MATNSKSKSMFTDFIGLYPLAKTIRFELRPVGATREHISKLKLLPADALRAEQYKTAKPYIDDYYREIIDQVLSGAACKKIDWKPLADAIWVYQKEKNKDTRKALQAVQKAYRKAISDAFKGNDLLKQVDKKELFTKVLPEFENTHPATEGQRMAYQAFGKFSTYFSGFHQNRRNIFAADLEEVSIPWRIANENFAKFLTNVELFAQLQEKCPEEIKQLEESLKKILEPWRLQDIFSVDYYCEVLTQKGIDFYNMILGGRSEKLGEVKIQGVNEVINRYRQGHPDVKIPFMIKLFKQILSNKEKYSFTYKTFPDDESLIDALKSFQKESDSTVKALNRLFKKLKSFDLSRIYVPEAEIKPISHALFGDWGYLRNLIFNQAEQLAEKFKNKKDKEKQINKLVKADYYDLEFLDDLIRNAPQPLDNPEGDSEEQADVATRASSVLQYWEGVPVVVRKIAENNTESNLHEGVSEVVSKIAKAYDKMAHKVFVKEYSTTRPLRSQEEDVEIVKNYLDAVQELFHLCKSLVVSDEVDRELDWYSQLDPLYESLKDVIPLYNIVRATLTKKISAVEKFKLKFETPVLCNGWDENKEQDNLCIILRKDGLFYLGILNAKDKPKTASLSDKQGAPFYEKMVYKQIGDASKDIANLMEMGGQTVMKKGRKDKNGINNQLEELRNTYLPDDINRIRQDGSFKGNSKAFVKENLEKYIAYYMQRIKKYYAMRFTFSFKAPKDYLTYDEFLKDVGSQAYMINFRNVSASQIDQWIEQGKLFLFQIYNKDFAPGATGTKNLHTLYWEQLFAPENLSDVVFKLDGEGELFFRRASGSREDAVTHAVGQKMINRRLDEKNKTDKKTIVPESIYTKLYRYYNGMLPLKDLSADALEWKDKVTVKKVAHEIVKDRRYTQEQFQIHFKTKINFKAEGVSNFNSRVLQVLKDNPDVNIIGLDRGERNLIYLTIIDQRGKILLQKSLNEVGKGKQQTNYQEKLDDREKQRDQARKSWKTIGAIKELKEGYLSQVVPEIVSLMEQYNAIIVMENLNVGFKRGRFKVEKQVYQKFEKALIDKLNYLTFKGRNANEPGGLLNGYQLAPQEVQMSKIGSQCGFIFYVPPGYTSKIDPATGFVNQLRFDDRVERSQKFYQKMTSFCYNPDSQGFEFSFDYRDMVKQKKPQSLKWTVCTAGNNRINTYRNKTTGIWTSENVDVTAKLKDLFDKYKIDYRSGKDIKSAIVSRTEGAFFKKLNWLLKLTLQMRYSNSQTGEDYILSPIRNAAGEFFLSDGDLKGDMPADADANGAFNIALKGLWLLEHGIEIKNDKITLKPISNADWFQYARQRHENQ